MQYARLRGWSVYHTHDSRHSAAGFPDLVLARRPQGDRPGRLAFAELKREGGRLTPAQRAWLEELRGCAGVEVYLWTVKDWPEIERVLE